MITQRLVNYKVVCIVSACALWMGVSPGRVFAMPSGSVSISQPNPVREAQIEKIASVLSSTPAAQIHLRAMGISLPSLKERLRSLDDDQLARMARKTDAVRAAGQAELIIAILVVAILVVLLLYLLNKDVEIKDRQKKSL